MSGGLWMIWSIRSLVRLVSCLPLLWRYAFFLFTFLSSFLAFLHLVTLKYNAYVRLAQLVVVLLTLHVDLGHSMPVVLMASLRSVLWDTPEYHGLSLSKGYVSGEFSSILFLYFLSLHRSTFVLTLFSS